jgi:hypothetical protein
MANPQIPDASHWEAAIEHYHWDRLEAAYAEINGWGIGEAGSFLPWYHVIEAETLSRRQSERLEITPWLSLEYLPDEVLELRDDLSRRILASCDEVAKRFGWDHSEQTLISILAEVTDAPWATHPYGYCAHKEPYEKICLPNYLVDDPVEFSQAVAHEYAHVVSEGLAEGYSTRWLEEALCVLVEERFDPETTKKFCDGSARWLSASELELAIIGRSEEEESEEAIWQAYQQAGWVGRYLASIGDEQRVTRLLRKVADESPLWNFKRMLRGKDRVEAALEEVYGLTQKALFANALDFLRSSAPDDPKL